MAGTNSAEHPVPMLDTAEAVIDSDAGVELFIYSLFPGATLDQVAMLRLFAVSWFLEGVEMGRLLAKHNATDDLLSYREPVPTEDFGPHEIAEHIFLMKGFCSYHRPTE